MFLICQEEEVDIGEARNSFIIPMFMVKPGAVIPCQKFKVYFHNR
jgi:hypothetical protein